MKLAAAVLLLQLVSQQPYIETFEVRLHNLDVVVTDASGKPVSGLAKDDFVVLEDGVVQEVTNFSAYTEEPVEDRRSRLSGQAELPVLHPPRRFVFFIDEMSLHPMSRQKLLKSALALVNGSMREHDLGAVIRPIGQNNVLQEFTSDRAALQRALEQAMNDSHARATTQTATEMRFLEQQLSYASTKQEAQHIRRMYADMARRRVEQRLGQLRALVGSLAGTEGKNVLVLITPSLAAQPGREAFSIDEIEVQETSLAGITDISQATEIAPGMPIFFKDLRPQIEDLGRTAASNGVTIYALQPDVPLELLLPGGGVTSRRGRNVLSSSMYGASLDNTQDTMAALAEITGGRWFRGDGRIDDTFTQVAGDLRTYYSLGYRARGDRNRPLRVEVRVKGRNDLRVRTRSEVLEKSTSKEMDDLVTASLLYPRAVNELAIRSVAGKAKESRNLFTVPVETSIPLDKLTFLPSGDGKYRAAFTVHYAAAGDKSDYVSAQETQKQLEITEEQHRTLAGKVLRHTSNLVVAPGRVRIAVGVLDLTSKLTGFHTLEVRTQ